jgi:hypothetical protein
VEERISFFEALGNLIKTFVDRALMYILILVGVCLLLVYRGSEDRRAALYRAGGILLAGIGMGMFGNSLAAMRRRSK